VQCTIDQVLIHFLVQQLIVSTTINIDSGKLKQLSQMYEAGIAIQDISEQMSMDQKTVKTLLKLLGYKSLKY
jgi:hypothetical protein